MIAPQQPATAHFRQRVHERIGNVDPVTLWDGIYWAIENMRDDLVRFEARSAPGRRWFRFRVPDERIFFVLIDTETGSPITVVPQGFTVSRNGESRIRLGESATRTFRKRRRKFRERKSCV